MTTDIGRHPASQLTTAMLLVAQFEAQIAEHDTMTREQRRTPRGRDLTSRIDGLHQGLATWRHRVTILRTLLPTCPECKTGKHGNCDGTAWDNEADELTTCGCGHDCG